jgi:hypothetical protein
MTASRACVAGTILGDISTIRVTRTAAGGAVNGVLANLLRRAFAGAEPNVEVEFVLGGTGIHAGARDRGVLPDRHARAAKPAKRGLLRGEFFEIEDIGFRNFEAAAHVKGRIKEP